MRHRSLKPYLMTLCMLFAVAMVSGPAHATVTTYTNRAAWEAALDGVVTDALEAATLGNFPTPFALSGGVLLTSLSANPVTIQVFDNGILGSRELHFRDFTSGVQFSLAANGNAFGFDYRAPEAWVLSANGVSVPLQVSAPGFIGFIDDAGPIQSFSLTGAPGAQGGISVDNLSRIGTSFAGLPHRPLGQAQVMLGPDGALTVSNIGNSGEDGVAIHLGEVERFTTELPVNPSTTPVGAFMESRFRGTVNGVPDQAAGRIGLRRTASGYNAVVDFSAAGAPTYTAKFYDSQGDLVFEEGGLSGEAVAMAPVGDITITCVTATRTTTTLTVIGNTILVFTTITTVTVWTVTEEVEWNVGDSTLTAANVLFIPEHPPVSGGVADVTDVDMVAAHMPEFQIFRESIGAFGVDHRSLGNAVLEPAAGKLTVSNLGSTGEDGIAISLAKVQSASFSLDPIEIEGSSAKGEFLQVTATDSNNQRLGDLKLTNVGNGLEIVADFSPIGSSTQRIEIYKDGAQAAVVTGHTGTASMINIIVIWPQSVAATSGSGGSLPGYSITLPQDVQFAIPGGPTVVGDEIRILAENSLTAIENLSGIAIQASGIPEITIVGVQATSCAPAITTQPSSISTAAGKPIQFTVAASGQGPLRYQWRRNGIDLADGGNLAGAESDTLTLTPVLPRDIGRYEVVVSNACGSVVSSTVTYRTAGSLRGFLRDLRMEVSALVSTGSLSPGQGSVLVTRLNRTQREITLGRIASAASRLRLFVDKVDFYVRTGVLTPAEAAPLLDGANGLIGLLTS